MAKKEVSEAAEKVARAEKEAKKANQQSNPNGNIFKRAGKAIKKFVKDLKGEIKKIVWPDKMTVLKSSGVVLVVVLICGVVIFGIDQLLSFLLSLLKRAAEHISNSGAAEETTQAMMSAVSKFFTI